MSDLDEESCRYEVKFVAEHVANDRLSRWVQSHWAGFSPAHPSRRVSNIYFDNANLEDFGLNVAGISRRSKTRLRWYGDGIDSVRPQLEFKFRRDRVGWKTTYPITELGLQDATWKGIIQHVSSQIPVEARARFLSAMLPVLINRYSREYFTPKDGGIRLTIDRNQSVFDERLTRGPQFRYRVNLPEFSILELKFGIAHVRDAKEILKSIPLRPSRSSKYVTGLKAILRGI